MKSKVITWREFEAGGDIYMITVCDYDTQLGHVTANWSRQSDDQKGELGYGIGSCDRAINLAEQAILKRRERETRAS
jgi:hypothetical protein